MTQLNAFGRSRAIIVGGVWTAPATTPGGTRSLCVAGATAGYRRRPSRLYHVSSISPRPGTATTRTSVRARLGWYVVVVVIGAVVGAGAVVVAAAAASAGERAMRVRAAVADHENERKKKSSPRHYRLTTGGRARATPPSDRCRGGAIGDGWVGDKGTRE